MSHGYPEVRIALSSWHFCIAALTVLTEPPTSTRNFSLGRSLVSARKSSRPHGLVRLVIIRPLRRRCLCHIGGESLIRGPFSLVLRSSSPFRNSSTSDRLSCLAWFNACARIAARNLHLAHPYSSPKPPKSVSEGKGTGEVIRFQDLPFCSQSHGIVHEDPWMPIAF